jgi:hypothetical protein
MQLPLLLMVPLPPQTPPAGLPTKVTASWTWTRVAKWLPTKPLM